MRQAILAGIRLAGLMGALLASAGLAHGEAASPLKQLETLDDTRDWQAVGRVNMGDAGFCTGTLIAPDVVLTAAHCLFDADTGARLVPSQIEFLAGFRSGRASAYRTARRTITHPDYVFKGVENMDSVSTDIALLQLNTPIRHPAIKPFRTGEPAIPGDSVRVVSYAYDRADAPSLESECYVLASDADIAVTSCEVDSGASGSPVFIMRDGVAQISSVVSAKAEWQHQPVSLATGLDHRLSVLLDDLERNDGVFRRAQPRNIKPSTMTLTLSGRANTSGPLFIKP